MTVYILFVYGKSSAFLFLFFQNGLCMPYCYVLELSLLSKEEKNCYVLEIGDKT